MKIRFKSTWEPNCKEWSLYEISFKSRHQHSLISILQIWESYTDVYDIHTDCARMVWDSSYIFKWRTWRWW